MRIAFVLSRFGREILGGAERLARSLAVEAVGRGWQVEVWTTCATDYATWSNDLPPSRSIEDGVAVLRFAVDPWDPNKQQRLNKGLLQRVMLPVSQQYEWLESGPQSTPLYEHVAAHYAEWDAVIVMPYLHSVTYYAAWLARESVIMWPCLHNEALAYMEPFRVLLESVWGVVFLSPEEAALARNKLGMSIQRSAVLGGGVKLSDSTLESSQQDSPFLLYVGRLEEGKNVPILYDYVARYAEEVGDLRLVVVGDGPRRPPDHPAFAFRGSISEAEKERLNAGALALCQPSSNESFSLVIMESWLAGRPVLVWSNCDVTRGHVERSKGGLWFAGYGEFKGAVDWLKQNPTAAGKMGRNGREYVEQNYGWDHVFSRFSDTLTGWGSGVR
jgi:glycosyltransferase involved in cell wall biosynthesis